MGGGVPLRGEVVLSLRRLPALGVGGRRGRPDHRRCRRDAGRPPAGSRRGRLGLRVDLASRDSATVGGTVATNAGGLHVLRYGDTRAQLLGLEAVLGTGEVVSHLDGLLKDNTGYDWPGCGSEGTLGVVTRARLRLVAPATGRSPCWPSRPPRRRGRRRLLRRTLPSLEACELVLASGWSWCARSPGRRRPSRPASRLPPGRGGRPGRPHRGHGRSRRPLATWSTWPWPRAGPAGRALALPEAHRRPSTPWGPRTSWTWPCPSALAEFVDRVPRRCRHRVRGPHLAVGPRRDGNVHVNVTGLAPADDGVDDVVFRLVAELGGSISAEHGIGTTKKRWLPLSRSSASRRRFPGGARLPSDRGRRFYNPDVPTGPRSLTAQSQVLPEDQARAPRRRPVQVMLRRTTPTRRLEVGDRYGWKASSTLDPRARPPARPRPRPAPAAPRTSRRRSRPTGATRPSATAPDTSPRAGPAGQAS